MKIEGKVAVVSGGGSGLGAATAIMLAQNGGKVSIFDRNETAAKQIVTEVGTDSRFTQGDVTCEDDVSQLIQDTLDAFGHIDIVVNCAGIAISSRTVGREAPHSLEEFKRVLDINVSGSFSILSKAAFEMVKNEPDEHGCRGVIINTASVAAFDGQIGQAAYSASKGALVGMTLPIARDLASLGVRCCAICPGTFDTPLLAGIRDDYREALAAAIPNPRRLGHVGEYAMLVQHIVENPYLNGEAIRLDGALRMPPK